MTDNPLLDELEQQTVTVALPTLGRWYDDSVLHADADPASIEVGVLGIVAEHTFRDPWLLVSGQAIPKLIKSICPAISDPTKLAEIDIETILLANRLISYGEKLEIKQRCNNPDVNEGTKKKKVVPCDHENLIVVDLQNLLTRYSPFTDKEFNQYIMEFEELKGQVVHLQPIPYNNVIEVVRKTAMNMKQYQKFSGVDIEAIMGDLDVLGLYEDLVSDNTQMSLYSIVHSIHHVVTASGVQVADKDVIRTWLNKIPSRLVKQIDNKIAEITIDVQKIATVEFECMACGHTNTVRIQMDPQMLFMEAEASTQPMKSSPPSQSTEKTETRRLVTSQR